MTKNSISIIDESYNQEILKIINKSPISTNELTLNFDRSPDFFALHKAGFAYSRYVGFFINNEIKGFAGICYFMGNIEGKEESIIYYTNLYILPEARKNGFFYKSAELLVKERYKNASLGITLVMKGNQRALRMVGKRSEEYPYAFFNKICGSLIVKNILITLRKRETNKYTIEQATQQDVNAIVTLLQREYEGRTFAPKITKAIFLKKVGQLPNFDIKSYYVAKKDNVVVGVCAALKTEGLKQTRVLEYKGKLRWAKLFYKIFTPIFRLPPAPKNGECFKDITLIDHATLNNNPEIMEAIIKRIYNHFRPKGYNNIIFGSHKEDEILNATNSFHTTKIESHIILGCEKEEDLHSIKVNKPYINIAFL